MGITSKKKQDKGLWKQLNDIKRVPYTKLTAETLKETFSELFYRDWYNTMGVIDPNAGIDMSNWLSQEIASKLGIEPPALIEKTKGIVDDPHDPNHYYLSERKVKVYTGALGMKQFNKALNTLNNQLCQLNESIEDVRDNKSCE